MDNISDWIRRIVRTNPVSRRLQILLPEILPISCGNRRPSQYYHGLEIRGSGHVHLLMYSGSALSLAHMVQDQDRGDVKSICK